MKNQFNTTIQILVFSLFATCSLMGQSSVFKSRYPYQTLSQIWELDTETNRETFLITTYKPLYILPFRFSRHRREVPFVMPVEDVPVEKPIELDNIEATLQLSLKTKIAQRIFREGTLWLAYTQKSYW